MIGFKSIPLRKRRTYQITVELPDGTILQDKCSRFPLTIGREDSRDMVIDHPSISRQHAVVRLTLGGTLSVHDDGSSAGTFVDSVQVTEATLDTNGEFFLGEVRVQLVPVATTPPPLPATSKDASDGWFYLDGNGAFQGPLSADQFRELAKFGVIRPDTTIRYGSQTTTAANVENLEFGSAATTSPAVTESAAAGFGDLSRVNHEPSGDLLCPHCWWRFDFDELLYIAQHDSLYGDPVLGPEAKSRFLPSRFTMDGKAIDAGGQECPDTACPRCHLYIPKATLFSQPLIISIVGAPSSGKSYLLAAMVWELRNLLPSRFAITFSDADATTNHILNEYEQTLFCNPHPDGIVSLRKTETEGELYNPATIENMKLRLPKPFFFDLKFMSHHTGASATETPKPYSLVLYDNAGEHFQPGQDTAASPATRHLMRSDAILFVFDPTQDPRFRALCAGCNDPQVRDPQVTYRQESLMTEMITRIRRHTGLTVGGKFDKPLVVVVNKFDVWRHLIKAELPLDIIHQADGDFVGELDVNAAFSTSLALRTLLLASCPNLVYVAEEFATHVIYLPTSAMGRNAEQLDGGGRGIRPRDIKPLGVTTPVLYALAVHNVIGLGGGPQPENVIEVAAIRSGDLFRITLPGDVTWTLPSTYLNKRLQCPKTGCLFIAIPAGNATPGSGGAKKVL